MAVIEAHELDIGPGQWPHPVDLVTMVAGTPAAGVVAARTFRWE